ncbi:MAG: 3-mercaptopyruvate sulfurtransferase [Gemmatimonadales bacterium]
MTNPPASGIGPFPALVSTAWLAERLGRPGLRVLDASWYLPTTERVASSEHAAAHIPGALFFDLDATSDRASPLPHMLPDAAAFARAMSSLGLDDSDDLVVYDGSGTNISAARAWWTFRVFGHLRVAVLDGGLPKWRREGRPLEAGAVSLRPGRFLATLDRTAVRDLAVMRSLAGRPVEQIVDMRPAGRFAGTDPEPRAGLRGGHIPGSRNLPYTELVAADGTVLLADALRRRLDAAGIDPSRPVVATCGSGTSACTLILALHLLGHDGAALYDGSWAEWGGRDDTPLATGP